jgi:L-Ala-D/L-Glu epimerase
MVRRRIRVMEERFATAGVFAISRGSQTYTDVLTVEIEADGVVGWGEAAGVDNAGETLESMSAQIAAVIEAVQDGARREDLASLLPSGGARNALDAALWDLEAKTSGVSVADRLEARPRPLATAYTISVADPAVMAAAASRAAAYPLLKLKLCGEGDLDRVRAVRLAAPKARLMVDANESWGGLDLERHIADLAPFGLELIEQPVPQGQDSLLDGVKSPVPLCADESATDAESLDTLVGRYQAINVKLDKTGGLTAALALADVARARGLAIMTGCMLSTSLAIAPAYFVGLKSAFVDLDSPLLLAEDRPTPVTYVDAHLMAPPRELWG